MKYYKISILIIKKIVISLSGYIYLCDGFLDKRMKYL